MIGATRLGRAARAGLVLGLLLTPCLARAASDDDLTAAEHAYEEIDFPSVQRLAQHALEKGGATPDVLTRLHVLLGIAAAAAGDGAEAKQHFVLALALTPNLHLDRTLSPKIRGPYLEAQGFWGAHTERLALNATPAEGGRALALQLVDGAKIVDKVVLSVRALGAASYTTLKLEPARSLRVPISEAQRATGFAYFVRASDSFGNTLYQLGSEAEPVRSAGQRDASEARNAPQPGLAPRRSYLLPALLGVAGLGAAGAGVYFNVRRERSASEWNGPECEAPGMTRIERCGDVDASRRRSEQLAIGFYAGAGALLTTSAIVLLAGHPEREPARTGLSCSAGFPLRVGCAGRF